MKAVVAAFNQVKALVGAFSEITNLRMEALVEIVRWSTGSSPQSAAGTELGLLSMPVVSRI